MIYLFHLYRHDVEPYYNINWRKAQYSIILNFLLFNVWFDGEKGYTYNYLKLILLKVHGFHFVTCSKNIYLKITVEFC